MGNLVIMPAMAQRKESLNMGEFAEEAIIIEEVTTPKRVNHFIEANTQEVTLQHLTKDCIIPSFASMEETISHQSFIGAVVDAAKDYFHGEQFDIPEIRISHPINGRIPSALGKKASELTDEEKTLFYQRMCFCFEIPSIVHDEYGNRLALSIGGVRAYNDFIEANTQEVTLQHLTKDCIIPSFASMEETISHQSFIGAVVDAAKDYFHGEQFDIPEIRISHPINGRIPSALGKKASELTDEEKTLFYQRMCFCFEIPSIVHDEYGNRLALSIGGVRAYNEINLYSKKSVERFKIFIGFRNRVCSNLMLTTDGLQDKIEVLNVQELYAAALNLFHAYNPSKDLHLLRTLGQMSITTSEFCQIIGRMRLYQALTPNQQKRLPRLLLGDSQINAACRAFVSDANFKSTGDSITGWQLLNLLNGSVKSSYIDNFLERNLNCTEFVQGIQRAKLGDSEYAWFLG